MKFIHAVVFDRNEFINLRERGVDLCNWDELCAGDCVVHCLYDVDTEKVLIHEDNTHQPVETMIENFLKGVEYTYSTNVNEIMKPVKKNIVKRAGVMVKEGKSTYDSEAVISPLRDLAKVLDWEDK